MIKEICNKCKWYGIEESKNKCQTCKHNSLTKQDYYEPQIL